MTAQEMKRQIDDLIRQNTELREAVAALLEPGTPRVLLGRNGIIIADEKWEKNKT